MSKFQARQGDVLLVQIDAIPDNCKPVAPVNGRNVVAEGEATGHCHSLDVAKTQLFLTADGGLAVRVVEEDTLTHQEHNPITLAPGNYRVVHQREYSPTEIRRVRD